MAQNRYDICHESVDRMLRLAYRGFLKSPISEDVEPNNLLDALVRSQILSNAEAEMVQIEKTLPFRQLRLFMTMLPPKGWNAFNELASILNDCGYVEAARHWRSFLEDNDLRVLQGRRVYNIKSVPAPPPPKTVTLGFEAVVGQVSSLSITPATQSIEVVDTFCVMRTQGLQGLGRRGGRSESRSAPKRIDFTPSLPTGYLLEAEDVQFKDTDYIASGGFGEVFSGRCRGQVVAIKKFCQFDVFTERMFRAEASNMAALDHDNIVRLTGFVFQPDLGRLWLVMELVPDGSLRRFSPAGANSPSYGCKLEIAKGCLLGLDYLHSRLCCHRDISPENILASDDAKQVKISDFGLSEFKEWMVAGDVETTYSKRYQKYMYMPPELTKRGIKWDWLKADVYSMGATLCELFSGQYFWSENGNYRSSMEILAKLSAQFGGHLVDPDCLQNVPADMRCILKEAIRPDYENRKTPSELLTAVRELIRKEAKPACNANGFMKSWLW